MLLKRLIVDAMNEHADKRLELSIRLKVLARLRELGYTGTMFEVKTQRLMHEAIECGGSIERLERHLCVSPE